MNIASITDGTSNTMYLGGKSMQRYQYTDDDATQQDETFIRGGGGGSARQRNLILKDFQDPATPPAQTQQNQWGSALASGCPFSMCDGSVRSIRYGYTGLYDLMYPTDGVVNTPE